MRCPRCTHRSHARQWWRLPPTLTCYRCSAKLKRVGRLSFSESLLIWLLVMLPGTIIAWLGGMAGFMLGGVLALVIFPARPWEGLGYELAAGSAAKLPMAVARQLSGGLGEGRLGEGRPSEGHRPAPSSAGG